MLPHEGLPEGRASGGERGEIVQNFSNVSKLTAISSDIAGDDLRPARQDLIAVFNPATGEQIGEVRAQGREEAEQAITRARLAQEGWEDAGLDHRIACHPPLQGCPPRPRRGGQRAHQPRERQGAPGGLPDGGLPDRGSRLLLHRARRATSWRPGRIKLHLLKHRRSYLHYRPRGVVLVISPWNFPFAIAFGEVIMALLAGNAVSSNRPALTPLIALKGQRALRRGRPRSGPVPGGAAARAGWPRR